MKNKKWVITWKDGWHHIGDNPHEESLFKCMCGWLITRLDNLNILNSKRKE